jgi:hypothetical protein
MMQNICDRPTLPLKAISILKKGGGRNQLFRVRDPVTDLRYLAWSSALPFFVGDNAWMDSVGVALFPAWVLLSWGEEPEKENNDTRFLAVMLLENFGFNQKMKL